jgi:hypothetical protein
VEESSCDTNSVHLHPGKEEGYLQRMREIGFSGKTYLALMHLGRIDIRLFHHSDIGFGMVAQDL